MPLLAFILIFVIVGAAAGIFQSRQVTECKVCGAKMSATAPYCPNCGAVTPTKVAGDIGTIIVRVLIPIALVLLVISFFVYKSDFKRSSNYGSEEQYAETEYIVDSTLITLEEYQRLQTGMTYEHCAEMIGSWGNLASEYVIGSTKTSVYTWKGNGGSMSTATLTFQNGYLSNRVMIGLK